MWCAGVYECVRVFEMYVCGLRVCVSVCLGVWVFVWCVCVWCVGV